MCADTKRCSRCREFKPRSDYKVSRAGSDGLQQPCWACRTDECSDCGGVKYRKSAYCLSCSFKHRRPSGPRVPVEPRLCEVCGAPYTKVASAAPSQFAKQRFCSPACVAVGQLGSGGPNWKGDVATVTAGRMRARVLTPDLGECEDCGAPACDRHHEDGNTLNNHPSNLFILCRRCHMKRDGRLDRLIARNKAGKRKVAA